MEHQLPTFISLSEAAKRTGLPIQQLRQLAQSGTLEAVITSNEEVIVNAAKLDHLKTKEELIAEKFPELIGIGITLTEAAEKYDVPHGTLRRWLYTSHYIHKINDTRPLEVDEAELAYCVDVYRIRKQRGIGVGIPLLDENGLPYDKLKHPKLSEKRRLERIGDHK